MKKNKSLFGKFYSPYMAGDKVSMDAWYEDYKMDPTKTVTIGGMVYSKVIFRCEFYGTHGTKEYTFIVLVDVFTPIKTGDTLVDEHGNEFVVEGFEMIRYNPIPEWYPRIVPMRIAGTTYDIGERLAKKVFSTGIDYTIVTKG